MRESEGEGVSVAGYSLDMPRGSNLVNSSAEHLHADEDDVSAGKEREGVEAARIEVGEEAVRLRLPSCRLRASRYRIGR